MSGFIWSLLVASVSSNCPSWLFLKPVELPSPMPDELVKALSDVNDTLYKVLDPVIQPGFAASVWYGGNPLKSWGAGIADKQSKRAPDPYNDLFRIASNTKLYTALLAEIFTELGYMSMDDPVMKYCPSFTPLNPFDDGALITFRMLVSHTAGLPDSLLGMIEDSSTTAGVFAALQTTPLLVPPGTLSLYSNLGISILGHVLTDYVAPRSERGDLDFLLRKYILEPLSLSENTGYNINSSVAARLCPAYDGNGNPVPLQDLGWSAPCGTMWSSMHNLAGFHQLTARVAGGKRIDNFNLSATRARQWFQPILAYPDNSMSIGRTWEIYNVDGFYFRMKSGTVNGFSTKSAVLPELRLSFAFSYNGNFPDWYTGDDLQKQAAASLGPALVSVLSKLQPPRHSGPNAGDYIGTYTQAADKSNMVKISFDSQGQLVFSGNVVTGQLLLEYEPKAKDTYRMFGDPTSQTCEHLLFLDLPWASPIQFQRNPAGQGVVSFSMINMEGSWLKQA